MCHELACQAYIDQVKGRCVEAERVHAKEFSEFTQYPVSNEIGIFRSEYDRIEKNMFKTECDNGQHKNGNDTADENTPELIQVFPECHLSVPFQVFLPHLIFSESKYKDNMVPGISKKWLSCIH
jgi:hypothetical protein